MNDFEKSWDELVEALVLLGRERSELLLEKLGRFFLVNGSTSSAVMVDQVAKGLQDWYEKPNERRTKE